VDDEYGACIGSGPDVLERSADGESGASIDVEIPCGEGVANFISGFIPSWSKDPVLIPALGSDS